ncbi:hypothetical protein GGR56DRAFT_697403 [Xylariaceae sp. FL0804]|nr:hypothetical protein GGR56DRAFT_697403 [Xylariaceae sp. FL0804]
MSESELGRGQAASAAGATQPPPASKRRKIRKGTRSCWECKRRKIRCTYQVPQSAICDGCRSRRTKCVSQALCDEAESPPAEQRPAHGSGGSSSADTGTTGSKPSPAAHDRASRSEPGSRLAEDHCDVARALLEAWPQQHDLDLILGMPADISVLFHGIICMPYAQFLSTHDAADPRRLLRLPPPRGAHPVLIARKLLLLGALLQGLPPAPARKGLAGMRREYRAVMSRAVRAASRLVTSDDELVGGSLDGVECLMIESMYHNNAGDLRRAWLTNRRAMAVAQVLGLERAGSSCRSGKPGPGPPAPAPVLEEATRARIRPDYMWFRIVCSDRYLSLMLGLPPGISAAGGDDRDSFASPAALAACDATERLERTVTVAAGAVLARNAAGRTGRRTDPDVTREIDGTLQEAAALMPPTWWLMASSDPGGAGGAGAGAVTTGGEEDARRRRRGVLLEESIRLTSQFAFHHLLVLLHLPHMLQQQDVATDSGCEYSRLCAASAGRAVVTQFVALRRSAAAAAPSAAPAPAPDPVPAPAYCRGIDFAAFVASTALCLVHVEAHRRRGGDSSAALRSLAHQRPGDRGLLERVLEIIDTDTDDRDGHGHGRGHDAVARGFGFAGVLRQLLDVEGRAAAGAGCYRASSGDYSPASSYAAADGGGGGGGGGDGGSGLQQQQGSQGPDGGADGGGGAPEGVLCIEIPHFGTIRIESQPAVIPTPPADASRPGEPSGEVSSSSVPQDAGRGFGTPCWLDQLGSLQQSGSGGWDQDPSSSAFLTSGLETGAEDWEALQGGDTAWFGNLTRGWASAGP